MRVVDYFAGAGGTSTGAVMAGARVVAAVNHWPRAVETHAANHPDTAHYCEDAAILDPTKLPAHDILCASPSCTGHTRARGKDQPRRGPPPPTRATRRRGRRTLDGGVAAMNALEVFTQALHELLRAKHLKVPLRGVTVTHVTDALGAHPHTRVRRGGR